MCAKKITCRNGMHSIVEKTSSEQKEDQTTEEHWKKLIEIEENCDFPNTRIKPADLLITKFVTSTPDEKLRDKLAKEKSLTIKCAEQA